MHYGYAVVGLGAIVILWRESTTPSQGFSIYIYMAYSIDTKSIYITGLCVHMYVCLLKEKRTILNICEYGYSS